MPTTILSPDATLFFPRTIGRVRTVSRNNANAGKSLCMRRAWFAEGEGQTPTPTPGGTTPNPAAGAQTPAPPNFAAQYADDTDVSQLPPQLQTYIKSLREENKDRRLKAKQAEDEKAAAEQKRLAEQGEWQKLAEQWETKAKALESEKSRADALEGQIKAMNEARIKQIPEAMRGMVPTDYTPEKLSAWLDTNLPLLTKTPAPGLDAGQRGERGKTPPNPKDTLKKAAY